MGERKVKMEKEGNVKSISKEKKSRARNIKGALPDLHEDSG
jgi:hypothetical protein